MLKTLLAKLLRPRHAAVCACPLCSAADDELPGCGWFESSHALEQGLRVTEHALDDAAAVVLLAFEPQLAPAH